VCLLITSMPPLSWNTTQDQSYLPGRRGYGLLFRVDLVVIFYRQPGEKLVRIYGPESATAT
jgi:hypothetical protein